MNLSTFTSTSSKIPLGWQMEWMAIWRVIKVGFSFTKSKFVKLFVGHEINTLPQISQSFLINHSYNGVRNNEITWVLIFLRKSIG